MRDRESEGLWIPLEEEVVKSAFPYTARPGDDDWTSVGRRRHCEESVYGCKRAVVGASEGAMWYGARKLKVSQRLAESR